VNFTKFDKGIKGGIKSDLCYMLQRRNHMILQKKQDGISVTYLF